MKNGNPDKTFISEGNDNTLRGINEDYMTLRDDGSQSHEFYESDEYFGEIKQKGELAEKSYLVIKC